MSPERGVMASAGISGQEATRKSRGRDAQTGSARMGLSKVLLSSPHRPSFHGGGSSSDRPAPPVLSVYPGSQLCPGWLGAVLGLQGELGKLCSDLSRVAFMGV